MTFLRYLRDRLLCWIKGERWQRETLGEWMDRHERDGWR